MNFNEHSSLIGEHAFLSASKYHWLNYSDDKLRDTFENMLAVERGTELHELAAQCITLGVKLPKSKRTLNMYVNDAIGFKMQPEQVLYYSPYCFGTTDAISFRNNKLRIHDLKTGKTPAHLDQLEIYAALFFLEYGNELKVKPSDVDIELRIYQNDDILINVPEPGYIEEICNKIVHADYVLNKLNEQEL